MKYQEYLQSEHWKQLKAQKFKKKNRACAFCRSTERLDVHHLSYGDDLRDSKTKDLRVLCRKCHSFTHYIFNRGYIKFKYKTSKDRFSETKRGITTYFKLPRYTPLRDLWIKYLYKDEYDFKIK